MRRWLLARRWWHDVRRVLQRCCVAVAGFASSATMADFRQRWCRRRQRRWWHRRRTDGAAAFILNSGGIIVAQEWRVKRMATRSVVVVSDEGATDDGFPTCVVVAERGRDGCRMWRLRSGLVRKREKK